MYNDVRSFGKAMKPEGTGKGFTTAVREGGLT